MIKKRKIIVLLGALIFSLGMVSVGYGFWTDHLDLEGDADLKLSICVIDDVVLETTSEEAIQLLQDAIIPDLGGGEVNNSQSDPAVQDGITEVVEPENPIEVLPSDPVLPPSDPVVPPDDPVIPPSDPVLPPSDPVVPPSDPVVPPDNPTVPGDTAGQDTGTTE